MLKTPQHVCAWEFSEADQKMPAVSSEMETIVLPNVTFQNRQTFGELQIVNIQIPYVEYNISIVGCWLKVKCSLFCESINVHAVVLFRSCLLHPTHPYISLSTAVFLFGFETLVVGQVKH